MKDDYKWICEIEKEEAGTKDILIVIGCSFGLGVLCTLMFLGVIK